jgi:hypothetical protein
VITLGTSEQFRIVREYLQYRYSEDIVAAALGVASVRQFDQRPEGKPIRDALVRLLFAGAAVPLSEARPVIPSEVGEAMAVMGLLRVEGGRVWSPVMLYPMRGLHLVSDRFTNVDGSSASGDREFVYFALTPNSQSFLDTLPDDRCDFWISAAAAEQALSRRRRSPQPRGRRTSPDAVRSMPNSTGC